MTGALRLLHASGKRGVAASAAATLTVPAGKVASTLTNFPVKVNLADMPSSWWASAASDGGNIRVQAGGTDVPVDVVRVDKTAKTGEVFFRAPSLTTSANTFTVAAVAGATAPAVTDTIGRNAVYSDYDCFYVGGDGIDRTGGGTKTAGAAGQPFLTATSVTPDFGNHQGIVRDQRGSGAWIAIDTNGLKRYDLAGNLLVQNANPIASTGLSGVDHIGDGCIVGSELFVPIQKYPIVTSLVEYICVFDADTLAFIRSHNVSARSTTDISGLAYCAQDGYLYGAAYNLSQNIDRYSFTQGPSGTLTYVSTLTPASTIPARQGIEWAGGYFWVTSQTNDALYRMNFDGTSVRNVEAGMSASRNGAVMEGITSDASGVLHILWADSPTVGSRVYKYEAKGDRLEYDGVSWDVLAPVTKHTTFTMGLSYRPWKLWASGIPKRIMSYGGSDNTGTNGVVTQIIQNTTGFYGLTNSTNGALDSTTAPVIGTRVRLHQRQNATTARELWINGALAATGATAQRPGGLGDRVTLGLSDGAAANQASAGAVDYVYLRDGLLSADWLAAEQANYEGTGFYTIA